MLGESSHLVRSMPISKAAISQVGGVGGPPMYAQAANEINRGYSFPILLFLVDGSVVYRLSLCIFSGD
jgi:hypothetical protein